MKEDIFERIPIELETEKDKGFWTFDKWHESVDSTPANLIEDIPHKHVITLDGIVAISCRSSPSYKEYPFQCFLGQRFRDKKQDIHIYGKVIDNVGTAVLHRNGLGTVELMGDIGGDYLYHNIFFSKPQECEISKEGSYGSFIIECKKGTDIIYRKELEGHKPRE